MRDSSLIVIKVGGSLLMLPDLPARLLTLLHRQPDIRPVFLAGGGAMADAVRAWDTALALGDDVSHDLALESMNATASLIAHLLPRGRTVETRRAAEACWSRREIPVLRMKSWLEEPAAEVKGLPKSWDVTSDSLAACVAVKWRADELWLLKSVDLPPSMSVDEASRAGLVDRYFPRLAGLVPIIRWCNLRRNVPALTWVTFPT